MTNEQFHAFLKEKDAERLKGKDFVDFFLDFITFANELNSTTIGGRIIGELCELITSSDLSLSYASKLVAYIALLDDERAVYELTSFAKLNTAFAINLILVRHKSVYHEDGICHIRNRHQASFSSVFRHSRKFRKALQDVLSDTMYDRIIPKHTDKIDEYKEDRPEPTPRKSKLSSETIFSELLSEDDGSVILKLKIDRDVPNPEPEASPDKKSKPKVTPVPVPRLSVQLIKFSKE